MILITCSSNGSTHQTQVNRHPLPLYQIVLFLNQLLLYVIIFTLQAFCAVHERVHSWQLQEKIA